MAAALGKLVALATETVTGWSEDKGQHPGHEIM